MPHSVLSVPAQRPERPSPGWVHVAQPIDAKPWSWSGWYGSPRSKIRFQTSFSVQNASGLYFDDAGTLGVRLDQLGGRAGLGLLAAHAGDPGVGAVQRGLKGRDLQRRAAVLGTGPRTLDVGGVLDLDGHAVVVLELLPGLQRLRGRARRCRS